MNVNETVKKGIEYCNNLKSNCVRCPLVKRVCISAPYGIMQMPDRKMDFVQFAADYNFMIREISGEQNNEENNRL